MHAKSPVVFLKRAFQNSPWIVMAIALHAIVISIAAISYMHRSPEPEDTAQSQIRISERRAELPEEIAPPEELPSRTAIPKMDLVELVPIDEEVYTFVDDPVIPPDLTQAIGDPLNSADSIGGDLSSTAIGAGDGGGSRGTRPTSRFNRRPGIGTGPGGRTPIAQPLGIEKAVLEGLRWLARHQNADGSWGVASLRDVCPTDARCSAEADKLSDHYDVGLTGLALLAFLGTGLSHESNALIVDPVRGVAHRAGDIVKNGLLWLAKRQNADGSFSKDRAFLYNEALATLAMAEAYGLTQNRYWKEPAQRSIDFLQRAQKPNPSGRGLWGWRYTSRVEIEDFRRAGSQDDAYLKELYDADTSVTGWVVMALKSAQISGLSVSDEAMEGAMDFCKWVTPEGPDAQRGLVGYLDAKGAGSPLTGPNDAGFVYHPTSMSALGMCIRIFTQHDPRDPFLEQAAQRIVKDLPRLHTDKSQPSPVDYYYWYYASLALYQFDGPDSPRSSGKYWSPWNKAMVESVLALQDKNDRACSRGGWMNGDRWSYTGGPLYSTALNVLTLEVYYRYENAFGSGKDLAGPGSKGAADAKPQTPEAAKSSAGKGGR